MKYPSNGIITQGFHPAHLALDLRAGYRAPVYAPHAGTITHAGQLGSGTNDAGLAIDINGGRFVSRLGHNDQILVSVGQQVSEGQHIAYEGYTGYTQPDNVVAGSHVHWVLWDNGTRVDGRNYITQGASMSVTDLTLAKILSFGILGRNGHLGRQNALAGQSDADLNKYHVGQETNGKIIGLYNSPEAVEYREKWLPMVVTKAMQYDGLQKQVAELQVALANEKAKPPKEVIKEVEKIVEVIKEVPIEVPNSDTILLDEAGNWLTKLIKRIWKG